MNRVLSLSFALTLLATTGASAQQTATVLRGASDPSRFDLAAGYNLINANAPPGDCGCFTMNGGFASGQVNLSQWLGASGEVSMGHASQISSLGQNLTLTTFMAGPRISMPSHRFVPFGEFLVGGARGSGSYFPTSTSSTTSASGFAYAAGGGLDVNLNHRFAVRAFDAKFLHTSFPNGVNGTQRQLQIGIGLVARFGGSSSIAPIPAATQSKEPKRFSLNCSTTNQLVAVGQPVHVTGETTLDPDLYSIHYSWSSTGGVIRGDGTTITVDTSNLQPGTYEVGGSAALESNLSKTSSCKVTFQVTRASEAKDQILTTKFSAPPGGSYDDGTREHLRDLFFNYDQSDLRPDAVNAAVDDAAYLVAHPEIKLTIAGYADERGSAEYNLALGMQRAVATRDALISAGVGASRLQVISYGKERSFCSDESESCLQLNRRAQLVSNSQ